MLGVRTECQTARIYSSCICHPSEDRKLSAGKASAGLNREITVLIHVDLQ